MRKITNKKETGPVEREPETPTSQQVREAAYFRWVERGSPPEGDLEDWFAVENKWRDNIVPSRND
jgi:hypothetical protein